MGSGGRSSNRQKPMAVVQAKGAGDPRALQPGGDWGWASH